MEAKNFGSYIKQIRTDKNMTIRQLELYSGVSNSYLSQLENGKRGIPSPDVIRKIANGLRWDYNDLMIKAGHVDEDNYEDDIDPELQKFIEEVKVWYKDEPESKEEKLKMFKKMFEAFKED